MMGAAVRLQATEQNPGMYLFAVQFSAPEADEARQSLAAELAAGDGARYDLGMVSPPTSVTWRDQRSLPLVTHQYSGPGPYTAELRLGGVVAASVVVERAPLVRGPEAEIAGEGPALFALAPVANEPFQRVLRLHARVTPKGRRLRVDAGAGQVREFAGEDSQELVAEMLLSYPKPGRYLVSVELLDGEGFWLETLAETPLEIVAPEASAPVDISPITSARAAQREAGVAAVPWLPYRNFKAKAGGTRTYSAPGGGAVRRYVGAGVWLTARREEVVGGAAWYQTAGGDWVKADTVEFFQPSDLCGIQLDTTAPPPPPPPPPIPGGDRKGVVTATTLNVRTRPGVTAGNPPVAVLHAGALVTIFEEQAAGGEVWYRIDVNRWVAAKWVRLNESRGRTTQGREPAQIPAPPFGWVVPDVLDVRATPGVAASNPVIEQLQHYAVRPILQEVTVSGERWCQVGDQQWVEVRQMGVVRLRARPSSIRQGELWVAVNLSQQTAVCYEGDRPVFAALISSGAGGTPTVQGIFRTWRRLETGKMSGPGYYIEDVTWTCYFYGGYALHTAYWHDKFGRPRSHGCVNLSPHDAWWIHQWSAKGGPNSPTVYVYWA